MMTNYNREPVLWVVDHSSDSHCEADHLMTTDEGATNACIVTTITSYNTYN